MAWQDTFTAIGTVSLAVITAAGLVYAECRLHKERKSAKTDLKTERERSDHQLEQERLAAENRLVEDRAYERAERRREFLVTTMLKASELWAQRQATLGSPAMFTAATLALEGVLHALPGDLLVLLRREISMQLDQASEGKYADLKRDYGPAVNVNEHAGPELAADLQRIQAMPNEALRNY